MLGLLCGPFSELGADVICFCLPAAVEWLFDAHFQERVSCLNDYFLLVTDWVTLPCAKVISQSDLVKPRLLVVRQSSNRFQYYGNQPCSLPGLPQVNCRSGTYSRRTTRAYGKLLHWYS